MEALQNHRAQQRGDANLDFAEIHFKRGRFEPLVGLAALMHGQTEEDGPVLSWNLHGFLITSPPRPLKRLFAEISFWVDIVMRNVTQVGAKVAGQPWAG